VAELIDLRVIDAVPRGVSMLNTPPPLFMVPKPGKPGQWRCIADMKKGGQNVVCASEAVHLPQPMDIVPHIYTRDWSATIHASKLFHMFKTLGEERSYLGVIHSTTALEYWYSRLPMGSSNSPGISGRYGAAFLRTVVDNCEAFNREPIINHPFMGQG
jgi:hypothetical protein